MLAYQVNGMTCGGCARAVTNAVKTVDESAIVQVDLASARVTVESSADAAKIQSAIEEAGYEVERLAA